MFGRQAFDSWLFIVFSAACFGLLFGVAALMGESLFGGSVRMTPAAIGIGFGAFVGYICVAFLVRKDGEGI